MEVIDAIYKRRATRSFTDAFVPKTEITTLLKAAVQAPNAMNEQPWAFAVIQGASRLRNFSDQAKAHLMKPEQSGSPHGALHQNRTDADFNIFYNAGTLIVICAKTDSEFAAADCFLAAENLMLAAFAAGLGTCPIGFALPWLRLPETKQELGIPLEYRPVLPIIVGYAAEVVYPTERREPEIVVWR
jgi:nitroreductase